jgi:UDP-glucose 4-epimerase
LSFDLDALEGVRICVTGADGFIGARLVHLLLARGAEVSGLHRNPLLQRLRPHQKLSLQAFDLLDAEALTRSLKAFAPALVFHCAGLVDWRQEPTLTAAMLQQNTLGAANVLEAARLSGASRVILFGSAGEYGAQQNPLAEGSAALPLDPYSASKLAATELALVYQRSFALPCTIVRPFMVYGIGEGPRRLLPSLFQRALAGGGEFPCSLGGQLRDFTYVDEVAEGALRLACCEESIGQVVNLGTGRATTVREVIEVACRISGGKVAPRFGAMPYRPGEPMQLYADVQKLQSLSRWRPAISIEEGLTKMWEEAQGHYHA